MRLASNPSSGYLFYLQHVKFCDVDARGLVGSTILLGPFDMRQRGVAEGLKPHDPKEMRNTHVAEFVHCDASPAVNL